MLHQATLSAILIKLFKYVYRNGGSYMSELDLRTLLIQKLDQIDDVENKMLSNEIDTETGLHKIQRLRREYTEIMVEYTMD